jgi:PAS domain S-box-containing protein
VTYRSTLDPTDEKARLIAEAEAARLRAERVQQLAAALAVARSAEAVARAALEAGVRTVGAPRGTVGRFEPDGSDCTLLAWFGYTDEQIAPWLRFEVSAGLPIADMLETGEPVVIGARDEYLRRYPRLRRWIEESGFHGAATFPLLAAGTNGGPRRAIGFLAFDFDREHAFDDEEVRFLGTLADVCAAALDRARADESERLARTEAEAERKRLADVLDRLPVGVIVVGADGGIVAHNAALPAILGHDVHPAAVVGDYAAYGGVHADGRPYAPEDYPVARALLVGQVVDQELTRYLRGDGRETTLAISAAPVYDDDGGIVYAVAALTDVHERETALREVEAARAVAEAQQAEAERMRREAEVEREAALKANRARADFLAHMSHELRTPLNAIHGYIQLLESELYGPITDQQRHALTRVGRAQSHLLSLINDVLNFAKLEAGRVQFDVAETVMADVVGRVVPLIEPQLRAKGLELTISLPESRGEQPIQVWADGEKLGQVLLNLLSNSVKFTPGSQPSGAAGQVRIEFDPDLTAPDRALLRVRDTGIGIPLDKQKAVFDPFVQVSTGLTRTAEGTGLGLAISRDLVHGMGGELGLESAEGAGSTFTVSLLRVRTDDGTPVDRRVRTDRRAGRDRRKRGDRRRRLRP